MPKNRPQSGMKLVKTGKPTTEGDADLTADRTFDERLLTYPLAERAAWRAEALRLAQIVSAYGQLRPKRRQDRASGKFAFVPAAAELCAACRCQDATILAREPHRAEPISPHTLDDWWRTWREEGLAALLRRPIRRLPATDGRCAVMSAGAVAYVEEHWRQYRSPRALYRALQAEGRKQGWSLPSESWLYRRWREMPEMVRVLRLEGKATYEARYAPYVPRNYEDLAALQVVCGDHSERDVTVLLRGGKLARPWLTVWQDLRTGLIWGWYLGLRPCSETARLAYADGVLRYGAQPFARPDENFYSYVYTDRGKDYCSHDWAGKVIAVHESVGVADAALEAHLVERRVGVLAEFGVKRLLARGYNAKEKPVERFFRALGEWEANSFAGYCGAHPQARPERWRELWRQHEQCQKGRCDFSPFTPFSTYQEQLAAFIERWQREPHERLTLGGRWVVPLTEFERCYTTRYELKPEAVALALLKAEGRTVRKNGVTCFQRDWSYWHADLSRHKGRKLEIRYSERDCRRVWVVLPDRRLVEAELVTPTPLLEPNKETLRLVAQARRREKKLLDEFHLLAQARVRGESVEERVNRPPPGPMTSAAQAVPAIKASVVRLSRLTQRPPPSAATAVPPPLVTELGEEERVETDHGGLRRAAVHEIDEEETRQSETAAAVGRGLE
jgi:hypothetical protein